MRLCLSSASRAVTRHVANAITRVAFARRARVRVAHVGDVATLATLVARNRARLGSTLGLLSGRASRILEIRVRRRLMRDRVGRILLRMRRSRCTLAGLLIIFARRVRAGLRTPIACTLRLPRGRRGYLIVRTCTRSGCVRGDLRTCSCNGRGCVQ